MTHKIGNRYRVCDQTHPFDGRIGTLEMVDGPIGYIMRDGIVKKVALSCLSDRGVLQGAPAGVANSEHYIRLFEVLDSVSI